SYTVTYGPQGFETPEGTLTGAIYEENNQITVSGLADATTYEFRVFESCLEGESSGVQTTMGTTLGSCPATTYLNVYNRGKGAVEVYWNSYNPGSDFVIEYGL